MRKILSIIIALMLVMSSTVVFANNGKGNSSNGKGNDKKYYDNREDYNKFINALKDILKNNNYNQNEDEDIDYESNRKYTDDIIDQILNLKDKNNDESTSIFINGKEYPSNIGTVIKYKNYQLPIKPITEGLGASLNWNAKTHTITITKGNITLVINLETKKIKINGLEIKNSILTTNMKNKTIVLIKFIAEVLGKSAEIDEGAGAVIVEDDGSTSINDNIIGKGLNQFNFSSKWNYGAQDNAYLEDNHWSSNRNAYYKVSFNGSQIKLYGATSPNHGIAAVSIDNGAETYVDLYAVKRADNVLVYTSPILKQGVHSLKVRVTGSKNSSSKGSYISADRVNILTSSAAQDRSNIALNKYSVSDSQQSENTASKGNDGNTSTLWCAADGSFNHWWTVDLGAVNNISGSEVTWEQIGKVYKYKVEVSADNTNWTLKVDKTSNTVTQQIQTDSYSANAVRFVRITITGMQSGCWASFSEFKVFGVDASIDTQAPTAPNGLVVNAPTSYEAALNWNASSDNVGTTGYKIYRNGYQVSNVISGTSYRDTGLTSGTVYVYSVVAYDAAGNCSNYSSNYIVTTPASNANGNGLMGEYYDNIDFTNLKTVRVDENINFNWGKETPVSTIGADDFSIRWTGQIQPLYSETYTFYTISDDGVRLWINGTKVIDNWTEHSATENSGTISLAAGQKYDIKYEYCDKTTDSIAKLYWSSISQSKQIIPKSQLYSAEIDSQAPTTPVGLTLAAISEKQINLSWTASADNIGVTGYKVYRNGNQIGNVATTTYSDTGLAVNTSYAYDILAYDASGNCSVKGLPVVATTKQTPITNIALGKTAGSDSEENVNPASKANDGNLTTRWCAADGSFNHWWKVDLGSNYNLTGTEVLWEKNKVYKYKIEVSTDGSTWVLAVDKTGNTTSTQIQTDSFTANTVRYVKITVTGFDSNCWASFNEFKVF